MTMSRPTSRRRAALALLGAALLLGAAPRPAAAVAELVRNGLFAEGTGEAPAGWSTESWLKTPASTRFSWDRGTDGIGTATIRNLEANDASWVQSVGVSPSTWYRISAWIRTEDIGRDHVGAHLVLLGTFNASQDLRGTTAWTPVSFWYRTGSIETSLRIGLRLGGYSSLNTGTASFAFVSVEAAGSPPRGSRYVFGGSPEDGGAPAWPWGRIAALLVVAGIAGVAWRYVLSPRARG